MSPTCFTHDNEQEITYLNYAATSFPKKREIVEIYNDVLNMVPDGGRHGGQDALVAEARSIFAKGLSVDITNVYFSSGATQALNEVILGVLNPGDLCLYDNRAHNAVVRPLSAISERVKVEMCPLYRLDETQNLEALSAQLKSTTKMVCLIHASNVTGTIYDIKTAIKLVRDKAPNAVILVDAAQTAGASSLSEAMDADFIVFQGHKHLHAPFGAAVLIAKKPLRPTILGGTEKFNDTSALVTEVGTQNRAAIYATAKAFEFAYANLARNREREQSLMEYLCEGIRDIRGLEPISSDSSRDKVSILALRTLVGTPEGDWIPHLKSKGIVVRGGLHCSPCFHDQHGLNKTGTLRISLGWDTTKRDIDAVVNALHEFDIEISNNKGEWWVR